MTSPIAFPTAPPTATAKKRAGLLHLFGLALAVGSLGWSGAADAQSVYPDRPVKLLVPYAAGGPTDQLARSMAAVLTEKLRTPVVVENRAGGGGVIGTSAVIAAPADGYTLLVGVQGPITINPALTKVPYDPFRDLIAVRLIATAPMVLMASKKSGIRSAADVASAAKAGPAGLNIGSAGTGTLPHVAAEMLKHETGLKLVHIPYKGAGPALADLTAGHVDLLFADVYAGLAFVQSDKVTAVAVTGSTRSPKLPNVPTMSEAGFGNTQLAGWTGVFAPRNTPPAVVARINQALDAMFQDPGFKQTLENNGTRASTATQAEFLAFLHAEYDQWARLGKAITIKME